jgi:UDPglucose--hexose-1-phosphate uridylyltransferase
MPLSTSPHRRYNPLSNEWVLVSPHRGKRPWLGQVEKTPQLDLPTYDPNCYLCPGNDRVGGIHNPAYTSTFVFDNDFAALLPGADPEPEPGSQPAIEDSPLLVAEPTPGLCRVVCFSPRHDLTLPELSLPEVQAVIQTWTDQTRELASRDFVHYVQVFENKGEVMGCSNPHPHSQIWASSHLPNELEKELKTQTAYYQQHGRPLLMDYLEEERKQVQRVVAANDHFTALVPFWAVWPFEILVVAHRPVKWLPDLSPDEITALADIFRKVTICYDNLFEVSFPYSMGFHQAPIDKDPHAEWVLHAHFYPPLLRSATVKKFMVGYEMLAMPQRDITPETAAERLRALSGVHYRMRAEQT